MATVGTQFGVEIEGIQQLVANNRRVVRGIIRDAGASMRSTADGVMAVSKARYVPIATGQLRDTGRVDGPRITEDGMIQVDMMYGDDETHYAIIVHEDLGAHHEHGQAKYLEIPFNESAPQIEKRLGDALQRSVTMELGSS